MTKHALEKIAELDQMAEGLLTRRELNQGIDVAIDKCRIAPN